MRERKREGKFRFKEKFRLSATKSLQISKKDVPGIVKNVRKNLAG